MQGMPGLASRGRLLSRRKGALQEREGARQHMPSKEWRCVGGIAPQQGTRAPRRRQRASGSSMTHMRFRNS